MVNQQLALARHSFWRGGVSIGLMLSSFGLSNYAAGQDNKVQPAGVEVGESPPPVIEEQENESLITPFIIPFGTRPEEAPGTGDEDIEEVTDPLDAEIIESLDPDPLPPEELLAPSVVGPSAPSVSQVVAPAGFFSRASRSGPTSTSGVSGLFGLSAYSEAAYESNPSFGLGSRGIRGADLYLLLGGEISFEREIRDFELGLSYYGDYQRYFENSALSNDFHEADFSLNYTGGLVTLGLQAEMTKGGGVNAFYQSLVDQTAWQVDLTGSYEVSALTELRGRYGYMDTSVSARSGSAAVVTDTGGQTLSVDALWAYSSLLKIGPGLRLTERTAGQGESLRSVGPSVNLDYQLTEIVSLNATAAFNWYGGIADGTSGNGLSARLGGSYQASTLWSLGLDIGRDVVASGVRENSFTERTSGRVGFRRKVGRNSVVLGVSFNFDNPVKKQQGFSRTRDYYSLDLTLSRRVLEETELSAFVTWRSLSSEDNGENDSMVIGISLDHKF